ncbi:hypothetical protein M0802_007627 [Mischocyttarus mexicanus]|nr:hypothetical protein M0802_007627 [Mischocyttarus mexicanus]
MIMKDFGSMLRYLNKSKGEFVNASTREDLRSWIKLSKELTTLLTTTTMTMTTTTTTTTTTTKMSQSRD